MGNLRAAILNSKMGLSVSGGPFRPILCAPASRRAIVLVAADGRAGVVAIFVVENGSSQFAMNDLDSRSELALDLIGVGNAMKRNCVARRNAGTQRTVESAEPPKTPRLSVSASPRET